MYHVIHRRESDDNDLVDTMELNEVWEEWLFGKWEVESVDKDRNGWLSGWYVNGKESAVGIVLIEEGTLPWLETFLPPLDGVQQ